MPIIGISLKNIRADIDEKTVPSGEINVNSSPTIENVTKKDLELFSMKDVLAIEFRFKTVYEPRIGEILMEGEVLYQTDKTKDIVTKWKKERKIEENIATEILNAIFRKCLTQAIALAHELRLPPPIIFPIVRPRSE